MEDLLPILVVDDDAGIVSLLKSFFNEVGVPVVTANDGCDALKLIDRQSVCLIVTDVHMPLLDGPGLCQALAERGSTVPVIIMTSTDADVVADKVGAVAYIEKPFTLSTMRETITFALNYVLLDHT